MIYLENRQLADVFNPQRIDILKHLSSQFGISMENALLYDSLAQKILIFMAPEGIKDFVKTMVPKLNTEITPVFLSTILVFGKKSINSNVIFEDDHVRKLIDTIMYEDSKELVHLVNILTLLHCKNVTTKTIPAPEKLNKKRRKFNKQPIFSYKILIIKPGENKKIEYPENPTQNHQRIHLARGHFKSYTEKNPLFGQHTGMWWWQPHVRGQNREGKIVKDYKIVMNG